MSLPGAACALEKDGGIGSEFVDHLAARPTWRTGHALVIRNRQRLNFNCGTEICDSRENGCPLGAIGHAVGRILHIAAGVNLPLLSKMADPTRKLEYGAWAFFITLAAADSSFLRTSGASSVLGIGNYLTDWDESRASL